MNTEQINELRKLADPLVPWCVTSAWEGEEGTAWLGNISHDDNLHEVACFDLTMYDGFDGDSLKMAQYYAAANPAAILALIQQRDELLAAIKDARELVDDWGAYAPAYVQEKHDLAGDLDRLDAAIAKAEAQS